MPNLRIIYDNAADRATLSAPNAVANLGAAYLKTNIKSQVCRSTGKTLTINAAWATPEQIGGVALPFCNLSATATMRFRCTNEAVATNLVPASEDFSNACWTGYWNKPGLTTGVASPDGGTRATRLASTDTNTSTNNSESGIVCRATTTASGRVTASIWARCVSGTLNVMFGVSDAEQASYTLTTAWQRLVYTTAGSISIAVNDKILNMHEATLSNPAWEVFGAQTEVGGAATSYYPTTGSPATRPLGYMDTWQSYGFDSGTFVPCPAGAYPASVATGVNTFATGGGRTAAVWLNSRVPCIGAQIMIVENDANTAYIEAGRLVIGDYWEPRDGADSNATVTLVDNSKQYRTDAGDLLTDVGTRHRKQTFSLPSLYPADRSKLWEILYLNNLSVPLFISTYPKNSDPRLEHTHQMFAKLVVTPIMTTPYFNYASANIDVEEI